MTHQRMMDRAPSCVILHNRNELKLYQGNQVYLNDGDNFELRFFNPLQEKIGVQINFNGINKGDGYLILNPGQDLVLDRFLDEQRKMLFETYVVDGNNEAAVKAIEQNGVISFNFFKEYNRNNYYNQNEVNINYDFAPKPYRPIYTTTTSTTYYGMGSSGTFGSSGMSGASGISGCSGMSGGSGSSGNKSMKRSATINTSNLGSYARPGIFINETDNSTFTSSTSTSNSIPFEKDYWFPTTAGSSIPVMDSFNYSEYVAENLDSTIDFSDYLAQATINPLETGRIEKGEASNQKLKGVNLQFATTPFHSITYKLMPISAMNRTIGEIRQYCGKCGYRLRKSTWEFCPHCGEKIN